jgi:hypothetical protein
VNGGLDGQQDDQGPFGSLGGDEFGTWDDSGNPLPIGGEGPPEPGGEEDGPRVWDDQGRPLPTGGKASPSLEERMILGPETEMTSCLSATKACLDR